METNREGINPENLDELEKQLEPELKSFELQRYQRSLADIKSLYGELKERFGIEGFKFSPKYFARTSGDIDVIVSPAYLEKDSAMVMFVLAHDNNGHILGHRREVIAIDSDHMEAQGYISVNERGKGLLMPIEQAFSDIYQNQANLRHLPAVWVEENLNKEQAERFERLSKTKNDEQERLFLRVLAHRAWKEQERFQAVYGPNGLLGFDKDYTKIFYPQQEVVQNYTEVKIKRNGNNFEFERSLPEGEGTNLKVYLEKRKNELDKMLS